MDKKHGISIMEILLFIAVLAGLSIIVISRTQDIRSASMGARVQKDLVSMRLAMEEYYVETGGYPKLVKLDKDRSLEDVGTRGRNGSIVSFGKILNKNRIPSTPSVGEIVESNRVEDISDFSTGSGLGGWNYNESEETGEIHVNLPRNIFDQGIDWSRQ